ncbi:MAG TPA: PAS domain S-box protein, partial [Candidatus Thermoplasmatota archaeon]|nr:PAS domain S-box protein [Candidatus Thermoplasmatota archaeon]
INLSTTISLDAPQTRPKAVPQHQKRETPMKHGVKKIIFAREKNSSQEYTHPISPEKPTPPVEREKSTTSSEIIAKQRDATSQKLDLILQSLSDLSQKYETVVNRITELEMKDESGEKNHIALETSQQPHTEEYHPLKKNQPPIDPDTDAEDQQQSEETEHTFFSDPFGFKRQHTELDLKKHRVELRMKELESFETRLMKEKDIFHARVEEFSRWQEKLIALESEIEKRRQELIKQENFILKKNPQPTTSHTTNLVNQDSQKSTASEVPHCDDETLDKIPQSAAIIQRGILKQINGPFLELLGYSMEEIVEKSYFDFIALEGLADVEQYYLDRLKGESISVYRTVFSAKDDTKISAEVSIKQTIYNGEKAEIAIITCIGSNPI